MYMYYVPKRSFFSSTVTLFNGWQNAVNLTIFWESNASDGSLVAGEVGHIQPSLQIPNLDHGVLGTSAKNKTIKVKLGTGESWKLNSHYQ